jgi:Flp pilus assembly protein TadB
MGNSYQHPYAVRNALAILIVVAAVLIAGAVAGDIGFGIGVVIVAAAVLGLVLPLLFIEDERHARLGKHGGRA